MAHTPPVIDLPDPMDVGPSPAGAADDLLSELVRDDIDRMLSDAEAGTGLAPAPPPPPPVVADPPAETTRIATPTAAPSPAVDPSTLPTPLDDAFEQHAGPVATGGVVAPPGVPASVPPGAVASGEDGEARGALGDLMNELVAADARRDADLAKAGAPVAAIVAPTVDVAPVGAAGGTSPPAAPSGPVAAAPVADSTKATAQADDAPAETIPWFVRVLEWVNFPLNGRSDAVRAAVGKVAILTLVNAIAVLIFVLFVRR